MMIRPTFFAVLSVLLLNQTPASAQSTVEVVVSSPVSLFSSIELPREVNLRFEGSGSLVLAPNVTLLVPGSVRAPVSRIFVGAGTVILRGSSGAPSRVPTAHPEWWGAVGDGTTDDTSAVQRALDSGAPVQLLAGSRYLCNGLVAAVNGGVIRGGGTLVLASEQGALAGRGLLECTGDRVTVQEISVDLNFFGRSGIRLTGNECRVEGVSVFNCRGSQTSAGDEAGIKVTGDRCKVHSVNLRSLLRVTSGEAVPRMIAVSGAASGTILSDVRGDDVQCGISVGSDARNTTIINPCIIDARDNGLYAVGAQGVLLVGGSMIRVQEPVVVSGGRNVNINSLTVIDPTSCFGIFDANKVSIENVRVMVSDPDNATDTFCFLRTRNGNTLSSDITVKGCNVEVLQPGTGFLSFDDGAVNDVIVESCDFVSYWNPNASGMRLVAHAQGNRVKYCNNRFRVRGTQGSPVPTNGVFTIDLPPNVSAQSHWRENLMTIATGTGARIRVTNIAQDRLSFDGGVANVGSRPHLWDENGMPGGRKVATSSMAPTDGTWTAGDLVYSLSPTVLGNQILLGWICVSSGSPGQWKELRCATQ